VAESPYLENLVSLWIRTEASFPAHVAEAFLTPGRLPKLRDLALNLEEYAPPARQALVERFRDRGVRLVSKRFWD
jgi:hypothetical protein